MAEFSKDDSSSEGLTEEQKKYSNRLIDWMGGTLGMQDPVQLFSDNDWMLIIKLHAMVETALNTALVKHFGSPELKRVIAKLDTSNQSIGKVAFAKALNILSKSSAVFIQKLSELRNVCVHDIRNFEFDLKQHLATLDESSRNDIIKAISNELWLEMVFEKKRVPVKQLAQSEPNFILIAATMNVMWQLYRHDYECQERDLTTELHRLKAERFDAQNQSSASRLLPPS